MEMEMGRNSLCEEKGKKIYDLYVYYDYFIL